MDGEQGVAVIVLTGEKGCGLDRFDQLAEGVEFGGEILGDGLTFAGKDKEGIEVVDSA